VTIPDTFADSHGRVSHQQRGTFIDGKYADLTATRIFITIAVEIQVPGTIRLQMPARISALGRRFSTSAEETTETIHLIKPIISVAIQHGNAVSFLSTFDNDANRATFSHTCFRATVAVVVDVVVVAVVVQKQGNIN